MAVVAAPQRVAPARWRLLLRRPTFLVGAGIVLFWVVCAIFGHRSRRTTRWRSSCSANNAPSGAHWFGTDPLGRDVLSRVITGARDILIITPLATILGTILGTALGLAMGYLGGTFDLVAGRIVEAVLALPFVIIAFLFIVALGPSVVTLIVIIGLVFTPLIARTVRAAVLAERHLDYVSAARLLGESPARVMFGEILPNVMPAILVEFTVRLGLRGVRGGHAVLPRLRRAAADAGLGRGHRGQLQRPAGRLLVADAVPGARHRLAGDRGQPDHGLDRAGAERMSKLSAETGGR